MKMRAYFAINLPAFDISIWFLVKILQLKKRTKDARDARDTRDAFLESVKPCIILHLFKGKGAKVNNKDNYRDNLISYPL